MGTHAKVRLSGHFKSYFLFGETNLKDTTNKNHNFVCVFTTESNEFLLVADKDAGQVILLPLDGAKSLHKPPAASGRSASGKRNSTEAPTSSPQYNILASGIMPVAVAFDPVEKQVSARLTGTITKEGGRIRERKRK